MIYNYASSPQTMEDVFTYFGTKPWKVSEKTDTKIITESPWNHHVELEMQGMNYDVKITSTDDPDDNEEITTDDPVGELSKFMSKGLPGGVDFFNSMASSPEKLSNAIRLLASKVGSSNKISSIKLKRIMNRMRVAASIKNVIIAASGSNNLDGIKNKLKSKGWKVWDDGQSVKVDIGDGIYEATITPEATTWSYEFASYSNGWVNDEGVTDDPIGEFKRWSRKTSSLK